MQDFGTQGYQGDGIKCAIRTKTLLDMEYHIQRNHTTEGLGKKLQSETRLAKFFEQHKLDFDRDWTNRIDFKSCKRIEGNACSARPDFFLPSVSANLNAVVLVGNDEFAHRQYACDLQRVHNIANALDQHSDFRGLPILYIRFNPHYFKVGSTFYDPPLQQSHQKLLQLIEALSHQDVVNKGVNLIYMNYDLTEDGKLCLFESSSDNDYVEIYKPCVTKILH
jgi:hypothetical protein